MMHRCCAGVRGVARAVGHDAARPRPPHAPPRAQRYQAPQRAIATDGTCISGRDGDDCDEDADGGPPVPTVRPPHVPVMLAEVLAAFAGRRSVHVDGTLGAGGHASAVLAAHPELTHLVGLDVDPDALRLAEARLCAAVEATAGRRQSPPAIHVVRSNFVDLGGVLRRLGLGGDGRDGDVASAVPPPLALDVTAPRNGRGRPGLVRPRPAPPPLTLFAGGRPSVGVDSILLDLGFSSMQMDTPHRGLSFTRDGPLDMRLDPNSPLTAAAIVNGWPESELVRVLSHYGEERRASYLASRIIAARSTSAITTTHELLAALGMRPGGTGGRRPGPPRSIHPATRSFQALRIATNDELGALETVLPRAMDALAPGGRLAVLSFHSLEDRIVKRAFRAAAGLAPEPGVGMRLITKRPLVATTTECDANPRARSAKLRVAEKL